MYIVVAAYNVQVDYILASTFTKNKFKHLDESLNKHRGKMFDF